MTQKPLVHGTPYAYYKRHCRCVQCVACRSDRRSNAEVLADNARLRDENALLKVTVDRAIAEVVRHWTEKKQWKAEALAARRKPAAA